MRTSVTVGLLADALAGPCPLMTAVQPPVNLSGSCAPCCPASSPCTRGLAPSPLDRLRRRVPKSSPACSPGSSCTYRDERCRHIAAVAKRRLCERLAWDVGAEGHRGGADLGRLAVPLMAALGGDVVSVETGPEAVGACPCRSVRGGRRGDRGPGGPVVARRPDRGLQRGRRGQDQPDCPRQVHSSARAAWSPSNDTPCSRPRSPSPFASERTRVGGLPRRGVGQWR